MVDHRVLQRGVALLQCGQEQGTATIVAPTIAIAARHSIIDHLEDPGVRIELQLHDPDTVIVATLHPVTIPEEEDIVFLRLANPVEEFSTIQLSATHLPVGEEWQAFGFPSSRRAGAWIDGTVATWLPQGVHPQDVELSVNNFQALRSYRGYSGGPVWVAGKAVAFLQRQLSGGLASTSVLRLRRHLDAAGVAYRSAPNARRAPASLRPIIENVRPNTQTHWALENALRLADRGYTILSGPPGSGKTIIAAAFIAADPRTRIAAAYFAGGDGDSARLPPEYHRDPSAFAVWLANETALVSGRSAPSRSTDGIKEHAASVQQNLVALGEYFHGRSETGVLIVDDFCGPRAGDVDATLSRVFPATPPTGLAIVLTAASEAYVRTAAPHLRIASVVEVTPLEPYDCERIVAAQLGSAVQSTDVLRIASASNGNPLILSYLIREAKSALAAGLSLPDTGSAVPTAQAFYEQQWSRLSGNDASVWLLAFIARLRGRMEEAELSVVLPESVQAGLPTAWRMAGHLLRRESDGIEPFHSSFRPFVLAQTASLEQTIQDRFAEHCAPQASDYATANVIYHHLRGSPAKQATAAALCTQTWLDVCAARFTPPAYVLADIDDLLRLALTSGSLVQTVRLLFARSRVRFR